MPKGMMRTKYFISRAIYGVFWLKIVITTQPTSIMKLYKFVKIPFNGLIELDDISSRLMSTLIWLAKYIAPNIMVNGLLSIASSYIILCDSFPELYLSIKNFLTHVQLAAMAYARAARLLLTGLAVNSSPNESWFQDIQYQGKH